MIKLTHGNNKSKYLPALSKVFTPLVMDDIIETGHSNYLSEILRNSGIDTNISMPLLFEYIYNFLSKNYRNEYIYKNELVNKLLLEKCNSNIFTEFRVYKYRADVVLLNNTSNVYEIKSDRDSFIRLEKQIEEYSKVFYLINVVTSDKQVPKLKGMLPKYVGILALTDKNSIITERIALSNKKNIKPEVLFDSLRKPEYLKIVKEINGVIPDVSNTKIYKECKKIFCNRSAKEAHDLAVTVLSKRRNFCTSLEHIPHSLKAYACSIKEKKTKMSKLMARLKKQKCINILNNNSSLHI